MALTVGTWMESTTATAGDEVENRVKISESITF